MDRTVLYDLSYGLYAIGVNDGERKCGCIVNTVFQITNEEPLIAVSMNKENYTYELIKRNTKFSVSILSEKTKPEVINELGFISGKNNDKWQNFNFDTLDSLPIVKEHCLGYLICKVEKMIETSSHFVILATVVNSMKNEETAPAMTYSYYHKVLKGKAPKKAPTYQDTDHNKVSDQETWVCSVCGYVYDGPNFNKEPDSYVCPICKVPKMMFEKK